MIQQLMELLKGEMAEARGVSKISVCTASRLNKTEEPSVQVKLPEKTTNAVRLCTKKSVIKEC